VSSKGILLVVSYEGKELFAIDNDDVQSVNRRHSVHSRLDNSRRYAYLCKKPPGIYKDVMDSADFRLSTPMCRPANDFSGLTDMMLEVRVMAPDWEDITSECKAVLVKSGSSSGYYIRLMHKGKFVVLFGARRNGYILASALDGKYKVKAADNATISFHVFKKNC